MVVKQMRVGPMATFCYIVGDDSSKTCALIDPAAEVGKILRETENLGLKVTQVINTHGHSDHTGGNAQIIAAANASLLIHQLDAKRLGKITTRTFSRILGGKGSPPADRLLEDGDTIDIGEQSLKVIHTPGHTMGGICLYTPGHVFTGDTLFVGAVGRTDLGGGSFFLLIQSIKEKLYSLPDDTIVWPGHDYGGTPSSWPGHDYGGTPSSTIAHERETNPETF
ncbi:MAG: MBL fold metallo-hydrolase [Deltaproteobacteria bacterium]|nr:MBL fold metallo-hydrolase [Deltaproteobacteria bacterium]